MKIAIALAHPNIAFIKYWGDRDPDLHIPANGSISMNLDGLFTRTQVTFNVSLNQDQLLLNDKYVTGAQLERVSRFLDQVRALAGVEWRAIVTSTNNFPMGSGIASSASAFAALALAGTAAAGLNLDTTDLSRLARRGSGSACRSVPGGFVEWRAGESDADSYAHTIASTDYWELADCVAIIDRAHKATGSRQGHTLAVTSPLQSARVADAPRRLEICRRAIMERDFITLANIVELDNHLMHAVMMTSTPALFYWQAGTISVIQNVLKWRAEGLPVCYTIDAGPNVHVICPFSVTSEVSELLRQIPGVEELIVARPGGSARLVA